MKQIRRLCSLAPFVFLISLFITIPVFAIPPLPASFYGVVKVNGANVADGTVIQAIIDDTVYAEGFTQSWEGSSVFTIDIPGDEQDTSGLEGGRRGDTVRFKIGGILAEQSGTWQTGTNVKLDLSVISSQQVAPPQPTPSPIPTQTAIVVIQPTAISTEVPANTARPAQEQASPVPTTDAELLPMAPAGAEASPEPAEAYQSSGGTVQFLPTAADAPTAPKEQSGSGGTSMIVVLGAVCAGAAALGYAFLSSRNKR